MKNIKMIVYDLDNTVLNNQGKLSAYTIKVFNKVKAIKVVATNRILDHASSIAKMLTTDNIVFSSGSGIMIGKEVIHNYLEYKYVKGLIKEINDSSKYVKISIKTSDEYVGNFSDNSIKEVDLDNYEISNIEKLTIWDQDLKKIIKIINKYDNIKYYKNKEGQIIIISLLSGKENAIKYLCDRYKINKEEVVVFGDDEADYELFKSFSNSVSVFNATDGIKKISKYITLDNNNDGVAKFINNNILNNGIKKTIKAGSSSTVEINEKERIVTKTVKISNEGISNGYTKLFYEMKYMMDINNRLGDFYPKVKSISTINDSLVCKMEYLYNGVNLSDIIKDESVNISSVNTSVNYIFSELFSKYYLYKFGVKCNENYIYDNFIKRAISRLELTIQMINNGKCKVLKSIINNGLILNNKEYESAYFYLNKIKNNKELLNELSIKYNTESHNDLIPTNIMIDFEKGDKCIKDFKLIDPRGEQETGSSNRHYIYDISKFLFGINGFDLIRIKTDENIEDIYTYKCLYNKKLKKYQVNFEFNKNNKYVSRYNEVYRNIFEYFEKNKYEIFDSLELINNYEKIFMLTQACNFFADIPCRLNNNNKEEISICFYLQGMNVLNEFLKICERK